MSTGRFITTYEQKVIINRQKVVKKNHCGKLRLTDKKSLENRQEVVRKPTKSRSIPTKSR